MSRPSSAARSEQTRPKGVLGRIWRPPLVDREAPKSSQETPKSSQKEPKRSPKRFQNHHWIQIFFCQDSSGEIKVLEGRRVCLGAQNRPQELPKEDKKLRRKRKNERRREEEHQERQKALQKGLTPFGPATGVLQVKGEESSLIGRCPQGAAIFAQLKDIQQTTCKV